MTSENKDHDKLSCIGSQTGVWQKQQITVPLQETHLVLSCTLLTAPHHWPTPRMDISLENPDCILTHLVQPLLGYVTGLIGVQEIRTSHLKLLSCTLLTAPHNWPTPRMDSSLENPDCIFLESDFREYTTVPCTTSLMTSCLLGNRV